jgi:hypothetical protein
MNAECKMEVKTSFSFKKNKPMARQSLREVSQFVD